MPLLLACGPTRIDISDDTEVWSEPTTAGEAAASGSGEAAATAAGAGEAATRGASWLDQRNQSRIAQFEARRAALLASASASTPSDGEYVGGNGDGATVGALIQLLPLFCDVLSLIGTGTHPPLL